MPNWVHNNLSITGTDAEVQRVKNALSTPFEKIRSNYVDGEYVQETVTIEPTFSFWNIVRPEGEARIKYDESLGAPSAMPFWYDWNCTNWGTKWDADAELTEHAADHLQYVFDTAWSPPLDALRTLGSRFPEIHIELDWEEEQGFGGTIVFSGGAVEVTDEYDTPSSHAEMMERKDYCHCEGYDEKWFSDCPVEEADETMLIPANEIDVEALI